MIISIAMLERVQILSWEHALPILISVVFAVFLINYAKGISSEKQKRLIHRVAIGVSVLVAAFHIHKYLTTNYDFTKDLPLYLCSLLALLIPLYTHFRNYWLFEILVFWIIAGTFQAVITPDIVEGFPSLNYLRYWIVHLGLLIIIFYEILVFKRRPKLKSVFKSFLGLQIYLVIIMLINYLLHANYFYLNEKPKSASILDYFGEWPYYLIVTQLIVIPLFLMVYLPFYLSEAKKKENHHLANN